VNLFISEIKQALLEALHTIQILDQFSWETRDMEAEMVYIQEGMTPPEAAEKWIAENPELVAKWTDGAQSGNEEVFLRFS
jgi:ABC-type proline/glycine betaine transport system substrate-binding protein